MSDASPPDSTGGPSWMGCLIPITAVVVLLGLGTCTLVTGLMQNRAIASFTDPEPRWFGRETSPLGGEAAASLEAKLERLRQAATEGERTQTALSADELNHLLQTRAILESLRETTRVKAIEEAGLRVESSQAVRQLGGEPRHLNAEFVFFPVESGTNTWQLELRSLRVPGREVPDGFVNMARELRLFRFDLEAEELQSVLRQIGEVRLENGRLVLITREGGGGDGR